MKKLNEFTINSKKKNVFDFTALDVHQNKLTPVQLQQLIHQTATAAQLTTIRHVRKQVCEYIYAISLSNSAATFHELNQKFGRVASRVGSSIRYIVDDLIELNKVMILQAGKFYAYYSKKVYTDIDEVYVAMGENAKPLNFDEILLNNAKERQ